MRAELSFARGKAVPISTFGKTAVCLMCAFAEYLVSEEPLARCDKTLRLNCKDLVQTASTTSVGGRHGNREFY